ncbi:ACP synthase [Williamsia sp. 1138]|uniref:holo-ACP synthase n=1 Tax=Williamsia sp. 1138 TaxID=1903117 RepID=UPI000A110ED5|nr:holo-ACP synthase [Williamsia sp. 1138]OZG29179.1 ACP synthase [Williamsia sp. 1138]
MIPTDAHLSLTPPPGTRIGCDVVAISDIRDSVAQFGSRFLQRVFTENELQDCAGSIERLSARFAAMEAVVKTFADPEMATPPREIEVILRRGVPFVNLAGSVAARARSLGWQFGQLSLSHTDCHAMAVIIVSVEEPGRPRGSDRTAPPAHPA